MSELAIPAGSMQCALVAFKEGADAIYLGLKSFSARKNAQNFTFEEYSKIWQFAKENDKCVYVTINTIITDMQMPKLLKVLRHLELIGCDGVIVQDLGVAKVIRDRFSSLPLHGSTQLAVHTIEGVKQMQSFGFSRVVLSRELTVSEIKKIRIACPDVELKVFIHGALCYGFSGLCMASHILTNRSANAGSCAQICRTWFENEDDKGWYFSMRDLKVGPSVKLLQQIGIDSLKVEGRMKSPSYVAAVTRAYRLALDGKDSTKAFEDIDIAFSRSSYGGWLMKYGRNFATNTVRDTEALCSTSYPGHTGLPVARILNVQNVGKKRLAFVELEHEISAHDGLMYFVDGEMAPKEAVKFSVTSIQNRYSSSMTRAKNREQVYLAIPSNTIPPRKGDTLYLISSHDQEQKKINVDRLQIAKIPVEVDITINNDSLEVKTSSNCFLDASFKAPLIVEEATSKYDWKEKIASVFSRSDKSRLVSSKFHVTDNSGIENGNLFIPLSQMKRIRRAWYEILESELNLYLKSPIEVYKNDKTVKEILPARQALVLKDGLPFYTRVPVDIDDLLFVDGYYYLLLSPICFNEETEINRLNDILKKLELKNLLANTRIGINNIAQIQWIKKINLKVKVFADVYLYLANSEAAMNILEQLPNLCGGYLFMETVDKETSAWPFEPTIVSKDFVPPLFISRSCFKHDSKGLSCNGCGKNYEYFLTQRDKKYKAIVRNCITYVIED